MESLDLIFSSEGLLSQELEDYEERLGQRKMAEQVLKAYQNDEIALTEAGTGIGKSIAYLATAMLWAARKGERSVIATYTIALQHQLIEKEIPFLQDILNLDLKAVLVKGMQNYLCLRKLDDFEEENPEIDRLKVWSEKTPSGCRSTLPFSVSPMTWNAASADRDTCTASRCPNFRDCFFFKARREAEDAQIIVVNHSLLLMDLADKTKGDSRREKSILPLYERVIIDEAHHLEEVALDIFSENCDWIYLIKLINRFVVHQTDLQEKNTQALIDLPAERQEILRKMEKAFLLLQRFTNKDGKVPLQDGLLRDSVWVEEVVPAFHDAAEHMIKWAVSWQNFCANFDDKNSHFSELSNLASRLSEKAGFLDAFFTQKMKEKSVRWFEVIERNVYLFDVELDTADKMQNVLFSTMRTAALCSATLSSGQDFAFLRKRLGVATAEKTITEELHPSPFDFEKRVLFAGISDLPDPSERIFTEKAADALVDLLVASDGGAFVLFTSNEMLRDCYYALSLRKELRGFTFLKQGDLGRKVLIDKFEKSPRAVLFGVDSFWEGVDVPGNALRLVVLMKLPFHALGDPLTEALQGEIKKTGGSPFFDYSLPKAIVKFKQGFGRLMRRKEDRGCVICLDKRLFTKSYGKKVLSALPPCQKLFTSQQAVKESIQKFFVETKVD